MSQSFLEERIDGGTWPLAVGDVLAILLVVGVGMVKHHGVSGVLGDPVAVVVTALPFLLGWAVAGPLVGAYSAGAGESAKAAVPLAVRAWVAAAAIGIVVRGATTAGFDVGLAIFFGVMLVTGGVALALWRSLYFRLR